MAGNANSGRKPKSLNREHTELTLAETSPKAARYLADIIDGKIQPNSILVESCKYVINQDLGAPKQRQEVSGGDGGPIKFIVVADGNDST